MRFQPYKIHRKARHIIKRINTHIGDVFFLVAESLTGMLITYHIRPSIAKRVPAISAGNYVYPRSAIVIQGPVVVKNDFTLETIRIYKKYFPEAIIILSTWDDTNKAVCEQIGKEGVEVVLNRKPDGCSYKNINFQIVSSRAGVTRARAQHAHYILKTRTDQRFYNPHLLAYLYHAIKAFPLVSQTQQQKRLIFSSASQQSHCRLYQASDIMIFGHTDDMNLYWQAPMVREPLQGKINTPEQYLMTEFLKRVGHTPACTIDDSNRVFADYCVIIDLPMLDFYFFKYERHREYKHVLRCRDGREAHSLLFLEWLGLFANSIKRT